MICPTGSRPQCTYVLTSPGYRRLYETTKAGIKIQVYLNSFTTRVYTLLRFELSTLSPELRRRYASTG